MHWAGSRERRGQLGASGSRRAFEPPPPRPELPHPCHLSGHPPAPAPRRSTHHLLQQAGQVHPQLEEGQDGGQALHAHRAAAVRLRPVARGVQGAGGEGCAPRAGRCEGGRAARGTRGADGDAGIAPQARPSRAAPTWPPSATKASSVSASPPRPACAALLRSTTWRAGRGRGGRGRGRERRASGRGLLAGWRGGARSGVRGCVRLGGAGPPHLPARSERLGTVRPSGGGAAGCSTRPLAPRHMYRPAAARLHKLGKLHGARPVLVHLWGWGEAAPQHGRPAGSARSGLPTRAPAKTSPPSPAGRRAGDLAFRGGRQLARSPPTPLTLPSPPPERASSRMTCSAASPTSAWPSVCSEARSSSTSITPSPAGGGGGRDRA